MTWGVTVGPVTHRRAGLLLRVGLAMLPLGGGGTEGWGWQWRFSGGQGGVVTLSGHAAPGGVV